MLWTGVRLLSCLLGILTRRCFYKIPDRDEHVTSYPSATWRLLRMPPADGAMNMAIDEAILRAVAARVVQPTLRLYAWEPPCLSLGRAQLAADADTQALRAAGFGLVRRPTGGKAILHVDELTYSVVAPEDEPRVAGGIVESYRRLSGGLIRGLEHLGVTGLVAGRRMSGSRSQGPICFEVPSDYEVTAGGRKLAGSAQMRSQSTVLQHGTVPLYGDITRICGVLAARPDPTRVRARATSVQEALGRPVTWDEAVDAMIASFAEALNLQFESGTVIGQEQGWARELHEEKYATEAWTYRA